MGFLVLAKHGLNKYGIKRPKLVSFRGGEKKREGGGEEKRKKKKMEEPRSSQQGMELLTLCMDPWFCLVNGIPQT